MKHFYEVLVSNIGMVHKGSSKRDAEIAYAQYCSLSRTGTGRAGNQEVTLWIDSEPVRSNGVYVAESN